MPNKYVYQYTIELEYTARSKRKLLDLMKIRGKRATNLKILNETELSKTHVPDTPKSTAAEHILQVRKILNSALKQHGWTKTTGNKLALASTPKRMYSTIIHSRYSAITILLKGKHVRLKITGANLKHTHSIWSPAPSPLPGGLDIDLSDPDSFKKIADYLAKIEDSQ